MADFIILLIGFVLTLGMTAIAFWSKMRFFPALMAGAIWLCLAFMALELNLILAICCVGMGFYMLLRSAIN